MKPRFFVIIVLVAAWAVLAWAVLGTSFANAQTPKPQPSTSPSEPFPIVPGKVVANFISDETVYRCGKDIVFFRTSQGLDFTVTTTVFRLSNDPKGRAVKYFYYDGTHHLIATSVIAASDGQRQGSSIFLGSPGWWDTYGFRSEFRDPLPPTVATLTTVIVLIRQATQDCLITKQEWFSNKG